MPMTAQELRAVISSIQWRGISVLGNGPACCPYCCRDPQSGHTETCIVKKALEK